MGRWQIFDICAFCSLGSTFASVLREDHTVLSSHQEICMESWEDESEHLCGGDNHIWVGTLLQDDMRENFEITCVLTDGST